MARTHHVDRYLRGAMQGRLDCSSSRLLFLLARFRQPIGAHHGLVGVAVLVDQVGEVVAAVPQLTEHVVERCTVGVRTAARPGQAGDHHEQ